MLQSQTPFFKVFDLNDTKQTGQIKLLYEDSNKLIWVGTSKGLFQFDGVQYHAVNRADSLLNSVTAIFQDQEQRLWTAYEDGVIMYFDGQSLIPWEMMPTDSDIKITGFAEDEKANIWIATYGNGIYCFDGTELHNFQLKDGLLGNDIYTISKAGNNEIWLGTDGGISRCKFVNKQFEIVNITKKDGLPDEIVKDLMVDKKGNVWIAMFDKGVCHYDITTESFSYPPNTFQGGIVNHLEIFEDRELWIGTDSEGIWRYDFKRQEFQTITLPANMSGIKVYDLHKDVEGNIWIASNDYSLYRANRQFEFVRTPFQNIQAVLTDSENKLWVGTEKGLFKYKDSLPHAFNRELQDLDINVISLYEDKNQNLWIGTFGDGVYCFNSKTKQLRKISTKNGLSDNSILSIDGQDEHIGLASLGGVSSIELSDNIFDIDQLVIHNYSKQSGLGANYIYKIFVDSKKRVWFASDGYGISVFENERFQNYTLATVVNQSDTINTPLKTVYSITEDHQGHIWISTAEEGIFEFDGQHFKHLTLKEGIRDLEITSLITDKKGNVLIVHPSGIDLLNPETHHLIYYDEEIGIEQLDPNLNAVCADSDGNIWIAGQQQLIRYTSLTEDLEIHPRTFIKGVAVFLETIDFKTINSFAYHQNNLVFDYYGVWFTDPQKVKYRYQLKGHDLDWVASTDTRATYSNLPPGKYEFKVMSTVNDTFSDEPIARYSFEILVPFWKKWWFILGVVILFSFLFFAYQKQRDKRIQKVNLLEKEKAKSQLESIKAQINPHFLFNSFNTLIAIIEDDPSLAVEYVEHLSDFYRNILQYRDKDVIAIQEELAIIQQYNFLIKKRFGDNFNMDVQINGEVIYIAPLTLQALVENAIKHNIISKDKPLNLSIKLEEDKYIVVENNLQKKKDKQKSTAFGLQSIQKRYELLGNQPIKIEEKEDCFKVYIPVIK